MGYAPPYDESGLAPASLGQVTTENTVKYILEPSKVGDKESLKKYWWGIINKLTSSTNLEDKHVMFLYYKFKSMRVLATVRNIDRWDRIEFDNIESAFIMMLRRSKGGWMTSTLVQHGGLRETKKKGRWF